MCKFQTHDRSKEYTTVHYADVAWEEDPKVSLEILHQFIPSVKIPKGLNSRKEDSKALNSIKPSGKLT